MACAIADVLCAVTTSVGVLYEAGGGFEEIEAWLFGPNSYEQHPYKAQMDKVGDSLFFPSGIQHVDPAVCCGTVIILIWSFLFDFFIIFGGPGYLLLFCGSTFCR